jgi:hypothetical protein
VRPLQKEIGDCGDPSVLSCRDPMKDLPVQASGVWGLPNQEWS